jgi:hypothetical protein
VTFLIKNEGDEIGFQEFKSFFVQHDIELKEIEKRMIEERRQRILNKKKEKRGNVTDSDDEEEESEEEDSEEDEIFPRNIWIAKPGENMCCGNGIQVVSSIQEVRHMIKP